MIRETENAGFVHKPNAVPRFETDRTSMESFSGDTSKSGRQPDITAVQLSTADEHATPPKRVVQSSTPAVPPFVHMSDTFPNGESSSDSRIPGVHSSPITGKNKIDASDGKRFEKPQIETLGLTDGEPTESPEESVHDITLSRDLLPLHPDNAREPEERFWNMLVTTVPRTSFSPPNDRSTTVLSLGAGYSHDALVLTSYFGGNNYLENNTHVRFVGIDRDGNHINDSKQRYNQYSNLEFYTDDATKLENPAIPRQADVVLLRNAGPFFERNRGDCSQMLQTAINRVTPNGIVLLTLLLDSDYKITKEELSKLECDIIVDEPNSNSLHPAGGYHVSPDTYLMAIRKKVMTPEVSD